MKNKIKTIVFDAGGVLIELDAVNQMKAWTNGLFASEQDFWKAWTLSPNVFAFETGKLATGEFCAAVVEEFQLPVSPHEFLDFFRRWSKRKYPGVDDTLTELGNHYRLACLSNTNDVHWENVEERFAIEKYFDKLYLSHKIGLHKPRDEVYQFMIADLGNPPEEIIFLDDSQINIDGARRAGIHAFRVEGITGARSKLEELGLL